MTSVVEPTWNGTHVASNGAAVPAAPPAAPVTVRVLHVCTRYAGGGSERRLRDMVSALPEHEHRLVLGADSDVDLARRHLPGVEVTVEPMLRRSLHPWRDVLALVRLRSEVAAHGSDLVVTHQSKAGVLGRVAARAAGAPPVIHSLSMADFGPGYRSIEDRAFRVVERALAPWTTAYAVVGTDLASRFGRIGVAAEKLTVVRSGVPLPRATAPRDELRRRVAAAHGLPPDRPWILHVGSLDARKRVLDLPILLQQVLLLGAGPAPFLVVAGAGPEEDRLRRLLGQIGLEADSRLLGHVDDPGDLFATSDVVVLLSRAEGLPQVLVQAAAAGTPFVATDVDGAGELLELGAVGTVVDLGDVVGATKAVLHYLESPVDPPEPAIDLSSWEPARVRDQHRTLVDSVLGSRARPPRRGRVLAVVGPDGSGKSTLSRTLAASLGDRGEVVHLYLGSGTGPSSVLRWPLVRAKRALLGDDPPAERRRAVQEAAPRAVALSRPLWALTLAQEKRVKLRRARRAAARGALVVCDRYPQAQVPGIIDGPLLDDWLSSPSRWRRLLARWERRPYEVADTRQPDLVIRLRVDAETAAGRRPGHDPDELAARSGVVERLRFDRAGLGVADLDANQPFEAVFTQARAVVTDRVVATSGGRP